MPSHGLPFGGNIALNVTANIQAESANRCSTRLNRNRGFSARHYAVGARLPYVWSNVKAKRHD